MALLFDELEKTEQDMQTKMAIKHFSDALREQREAHGLSQVKLMEKSGVNQKVISEIETGGNFKIGTYIKICRAIGIVPKVRFIKLKNR